MVKITNADVKKWTAAFKKKVNQKYSPEKIILFGSRARKDNLIESDFDVIIVSKKFKNVKWPIRLGDVAELWDGLIAIEPLCYTPEEFAIKVKEIGIVRKAVEEGIEL